MTTTDHPESPDLEKWAQYLEGQLPQEEEDALREHFANHPQSAQLLLDLETFLNAPDEEEETLSFEKAAVWRSVRPKKQRPAWYVPSSLAAAFLVGVLALGVWTSGDRQELRDLRQVVDTLTAPQPNSPIYHLVPTTRSSRPARNGFPLAQEMQTFTLVFNLVSDNPEATFRAELIDTEGDVALSVPNLELDDYGTLTLGLSRQSLEPGDYLVHVYAMGPATEGAGASAAGAGASAAGAGDFTEGGRPDPVASYTFRLETP